MLIIIFSILLFLMVIYLLFVPVTLHIDTNKNQYYIQVLGLFKMSALADEKEALKIKIKICFVTYYLYPLKKKKVTEREGSKKKKYSRKFNHKIGLKLLKSFKVKRFFIDIDTGDYLLNAKLYPLFALLDFEMGNIKINFEGRNQLMLNIQNRPIYILKSFINT